MASLVPSFFRRGYRFGGLDATTVADVPDASATEETKALFVLQRLRQGFDASFYRQGTQVEVLEKVVQGLSRTPVNDVAVQLLSPQDNRRWGKSSLERFLLLRRDLQARVLPRLPTEDRAFELSQFRTALNRYRVKIKDPLYNFSLIADNIVWGVAGALALISVGSAGVRRYQDSRRTKRQ